MRLIDFMEKNNHLLSFAFKFLDFVSHEVHCLAQCVLVKGEFGARSGVKFCDGMRAAQ